MKKYPQINLVENQSLMEKFCAAATDFSHFLLLNNNSGKGFTVALACAEEIKLEAEENAFAKLKQFINQNSGPVYGYFTYDLKNDVEKLSSNNCDLLNFPALHFFKPAVIFNYEAGKLNCKYDSDIYSNEDVRILLEKILNQKLESLNRKENIRFKPRMSKAEYLKKAETVLNHIQKGNIYEMNLCQEFYTENALINPVEVYLELNKLTEAPFSCFGKFGSHYVMSASPERFLKKKGAKLISQPIKGTAKRSSNPAEDEKLKNDLYNDPKERSENVMIVDLVRNDLSRSAKRGTVKVEELFGIYSFKTVHQMISTITAELDDEVHFIDAIKAAYPMGSMTGAPKIRAMEIIEELEMSKRGLYSGAIGCFTEKGDFDFNVVIRTLLYNSQNKYLSFQVGSAITANSIPEKEYEECLLKAKAMFAATDLRK